MEKTELKKIKQKWDNEASEFGTAREASWKDLLIYKEINIIKRYLTDGDSLLDVGCANGFCTLKFASKRIPRIVGVDYSEEMIKNANKSLAGMPDSVKKRVSFKVSDMLDLERDFEKLSFDQILSKRAICNLTSPELQKEAIRNISSILKPGGQFLMSEPTASGLCRINTVRKKWELDELSAPWHNLYIDEAGILAFTEKFFKLEKRVDFSSSYYFGSRLLYAFLAKKLRLTPRHNSVFNKLALIMPSFGNFGVQKLFIFRKRP